MIEENSKRLSGETTCRGAGERGTYTPDSAEQERTAFMAASGSLALLANRVEILSGLIVHGNTAGIVSRMCAALDKVIDARGSQIIGTPTPNPILVATYNQCDRLCKAILAAGGRTAPPPSPWVEDAIREIERLSREPVAEDLRVQLAVAETLRRNEAANEADALRARLVVSETMHAGAAYVADTLRGENASLNVHLNAVREELSDAKSAVDTLTAAMLAVQKVDPSPERCLVEAALARDEDGKRFRLNWIAARWDKGLGMAAEFGYALFKPETIRAFALFVFVSALGAALLVSSPVIVRSGAEGVAHVRSGE